MEKAFRILERSEMNEGWILIFNDNLELDESLQDMGIENSARETLIEAIHRHREHVGLEIAKSSKLMLQMMNPPAIITTCHTIPECNDSFTIVSTNTYFNGRMCHWKTKVFRTSTWLEQQLL